jgi:flagellar hook protein FlgE
MIAAQRAYEMNAKVITGADQMMQTATQMFR